MKLQTNITISPFPAKISYHKSAVFIGSCFASNIGRLMKERKFSVSVNPFGVVYNPFSLAQSLRRLRQRALFAEKELIVCNDLYTTFFHHSSFSDADSAIFLQKANDALKEASALFCKAEFVIVSLGTAGVYQHEATAMIVNNCHKLPASQFKRKRLSIEEMTTALAQEIALNDKKTWIFTVSPIRHWKDGARENQLSKAALLLTVEALQQQFPNVYYFPAYEIMMDELRDYRFYAEDMLHPSAQAVAYIWQRFSEAAFDDETKTIVAELEKINAAQQHRPLHPETKSYRQFMKNLEKQQQQFRERYPFVKI